jgi:putative ABC transport system ATP-binding protein
LSTLVKITDLCKSYTLSKGKLPVLEKINMELATGEFVAIMGASGSGKSTLMNILGLLDQPDSGSYQLVGQEVCGLSDNQRSQIRNETLGFVFQSFFLLPRITALQNVGLPLVYRGIKANDRDQLAFSILERVGMAPYVTHKPQELSGGQQQRVAIARALVNKPKIILADEPTGALDSKTGSEVMALFKLLNQEHGVTFIIVTHDPRVAQQCSRTIHIKDGVIDQ